jgi:sulfate adenylyltransferase subunit 1 (EFTu-like GTPase family)
VRPNQTEITLPSLQLAVVNHLFLHSQAMPEVFPPLSVVLSLSTHVDLGRGDMLTDPERIPAMSKRVLANLIWMSRSPLRVKSPYLIKYTTQTLCGYVTRVCHRTDLGSFEQQEINTLQVNDIGTGNTEANVP